MQKQIGIRELKGHLSEYVRRSAAGFSFVITDRGRPVARLLPPESPADDLEGQLRAMAARGEITLPTRTRPKTFEPLQVPGLRLSEAIIEDREDRF